MTSSTAVARPQHRDVPARMMLCAVQRLRPEHVRAFVNGASQALPLIVAQQGAEPLGRVAVIYHQPVTDTSDGPVEVCVPYAGELNVPEGLSARHEPAHVEAYLPLTKPGFADAELLDEAWRSLRHYARANGEIMGPMRRIDYGVWETHGEGEMVGEIILPLKWFNQLRPNTRGRLFP
ncbi:hypothetical protein [Deinococcus sp.]|uniref:hypothetical protein n=1 Tax=Deinococcus sp. TaxID=47478 RepID=UPI003B59D945